MTNSIVAATIDAAETELIEVVKRRFNDLRSKLLTSAMTSHVPREPSLAEARDPTNKSGVNLTPRGIEIIYRYYDNDASMRKASKMMGISQQAAKWRFEKWKIEGGLKRKRAKIDLD